MKQDDVTNNELWNTLTGCIKSQWKTGERGVTNGTPEHCVWFYATTKHVLSTDGKWNSEQREGAGFAVP